jgi:HEAT repeat protein
MNLWPLGRVVALFMASFGVLADLWPWATPAACQATRQDSIIRVLTMHESSWDWLSYESGRFAVQEYGAEAGTVAEQVLANPTNSPHPWPRLMAALRVAAYERSGFSLDRLKDLASGRYAVRADRNLNYGFRLAALRALASRSRSELGAYWLPLLGDRYPEVRQAAVAGLACALGSGAAEALSGVAVSDRVPAVRKAAEYGLREIREEGDSARVCLYGLWTRSQAANGEVTVDSGLVRRAERYFGFRRQ